MKNLHDFLYDFLIIHKISYYKVRVSTRGGSSLILQILEFSRLHTVFVKKFSPGCWLNQCVLRNTLAGSKTWFLCPGTIL